MRRAKCGDCACFVGLRPKPRNAPCVTWETDENEPPEPTKDTDTCDDYADATDAAADDAECPNCRGSGGGPDAALRCPSCHGSGMSASYREAQREARAEYLADCADDGEYQGVYDRD